MDEMVSAECERQKMERPDFRFTRRDVRAFTRLGRLAIEAASASAGGAGVPAVHRGGRGQSFVYELVFERPRATAASLCWAD